MGRLTPLHRHSLGSSVLENFVACVEAFTGVVLQRASAWLPRHLIGSRLRSSAGLESVLLDGAHLLLLGCRHKYHAMRLSPYLDERHAVGERFAS